MPSTRPHPDLGGAQLAAQGHRTNLGSGQTLALVGFIGLSVVSVAWLWLAERKTPRRWSRQS